MDEKLFLLALYVGAGLVLAGLAVPLILEKIGPNPFYGFRLPKAFESRETWYAVNHHGGKGLLWTAAVFEVAAIGLYLVPGLGVDGYALAVLAVLVVSFAVTLSRTVRYMNALSKSRRGTGPDAADGGG